MKSPKFQKRFYRDWVYPGKMFEARLRVMETDLHIITDKPLDEEFTLEYIRRRRSEIEKYINQRDARFLSSLKPLAVELTAPPIVREMAEQARKADVGPMAAVAGAIARYAGTALVKKGYKDVIVENGGDLFIKASRTVRIGIYAGRSRFSRRISLVIAPGETPLGIATSSGTVGHSLSFGRTDGATVIAKNAALADACATAVANRVSAREDMAAAIGFARAVRGVRGVLIVHRNTMATWGAVTLA